MMSLVGPLLAALLAATQAAPQTPQRRPWSTEVVDASGLPVPNAHVVFYAPPVAYLKGDPIEVNTTADAHGKFSLVVPPLQRAVVNGVNLLAYSPRKAIGAIPYVGQNRPVVLQVPHPRSVKVEGHDGAPVAGARVALRHFAAFGGSLVEVLGSLADSLATSTGPDGTASIGYLAPRDQLAALRITADSIGSQDFVLVENPGRGSEPPVFTIKLKPTVSISGRLVDENAHPVIGQAVEVWSRGNGRWLLANQVGFKDGPLRTDADGSFQTPTNLQQGSSYRIAIRAPGKDPIFSEWFIIQDKPIALPLLVQRSLRTIRGRVVDHQSKPIAGARVFQSGDGPERTETTTEADGRFSLGGLRLGRVFVLVRKDGYRLFGQLLKPTDANFTAELVHDNEPRTRVMKMLADTVSTDESHALARRLLEPCWKVLAQGDDATKARFLEALAPADPAGAIEKLSAVKFASDGWRLRLLREIVLALAARDEEEAASFAESIPNPATKSWAFVHLSDRLPKQERDRKLALLDRALPQARIAAIPSDQLDQLGDVALRFSELGEADKARALFAEGAQIASKLDDKTDFKRGIFAARLARVDLPPAEAIARDFKGTPEESRILGNMAFILAETRPEDAERLWKQSAGKRRLGMMDPVLAWKLATADPARALRVVEGFKKPGFGAPDYFYLALGARPRDESVSRQAFHTGLQLLDRMIQEHPERYMNEALLLLPVVERTDPALVPEIVLRHVASRLPYGNPRAPQPDTGALQIAEIANYDREAAAALLEPVLARIEQASPSDLAHWRAEFLAWSFIDPRAAVARLEKTPIAQDTDLYSGGNAARFVVGESLARGRLDRGPIARDARDVVFSGKRNF